MNTRFIRTTKTRGERLVLVLAAVAVVLAMHVVLGASPALAITERPASTAAMTNGEVYASVLSEDGTTLFIGGKFSRIKERQADGDVIGRAVHNLAAINVATGDMIRTWRPEVLEGDPAVVDRSVVRSLVVKDGALYVGGNFTAVKGDPDSNPDGIVEPRKHLAAFDAETGAVLPFAPQIGGDTSFVYALEADDSRLYIGGGFSKVTTQIGAEPPVTEQRRNLAAFNLATAPIEPGLLDPAWKPETSVAPSCTSPKCSSKVRSLKLGPLQSTIFVGGSFSRITGSDGIGDDRQSVARLVTSTGNLQGWKIPAGTIVPPQTAWDFAWADGRLYVGFGSTSNYLAAFDIRPGGGGAQLWRFRTTGNVQSVALTPNGSRLFFGGHFGLNKIDARVVCGNKPLRGLASLNPNTGTIYCDFVPSLDQDHRPSYEGAWTLTTTRDYLWVGGGFTGVSDSISPGPATDSPRWPQTNLARFRLD